MELRAVIGRSSLRHRRLSLAAGFALLFALAAVGSGLASPAFDPGFGEGGVAEAPLPAGERQAIFEELGQGPLIRDLAVRRHGELVAAIGSGTENGYFGAASFRPDGSLDRRFGGDGFVQAGKIFPGLGFVSEAQGIAVQRDGKVVLVGYRTGIASDTPAPIVMRLRPDGHPDRSFGRGGVMAPRPHGRRPDVLHAVAIQPGGRIVAVGARNERYHRSPPSRRPAALVVAYRPDGRLDRSFGKGARVFFFGPKSYYLHTALFDISILSHGEILVAGYRANRLFVAKLKRNGRLDRSFGAGDGRVSIDLGGGCCPVAASLFVLEDGSSVALADTGEPGVALVRLRPDGRLDPRFGHRGIVRGGIARRLPSAFAVAVQGNGRIVAVGMDVRRKHVFVTLRYRFDGRPDRSFGKRGVMALPIGRSSAAISVVRLPNGQVVVGGGAKFQRNKRLEYSLLLARLRR